MQHLGASGTTCLVLEGGDIITVRQDRLSGHDAHIEIMGSIDAGIAAARWSPDEELLLVVAKDDNAIFMSSTFDPVVELLMTPDDLGASKHVSVGWGKKETQFQGRGAKAMRDPTIPERVDQGVPSPHEDGSTTISWRGDGAYVAVNSVQQGSRRLVRVYSREGELDSASEPVDGLEGALSWRPSGNLIAGIQRLPDRVDVVFFERNGLRHGQFTLRASQGSVVGHADIRLAWNSDSTVLAVALDGLIQLWTMGNYHWYLKQETPMNPGRLLLAWHPEKALRLAAATPTHAILTEYIFHTARGSCRPPHDTGVVAVIDGATLKLTPFRTANVPPPMALFDVDAESAVIDVAFGRRNASFAVMHRQGVDIYDFPAVNGRPVKPQLRMKLPPAVADGVPLSICCVSNELFRLLHHVQNGPVHFAIDGQAGRSSEEVKGERTLVSTSLFEDDDAVEGYGQDLAGNLYKLSESGSEPLSFSCPTHLPWFEIGKSEGSTTAFGLSRNGHLYANTKLLAKNCTSFVVTPSHLIFTTSNHFVKYVHLTQDVAGMLHGTEECEPSLHHVADSCVRSPRGPCR